MFDISDSRVVMLAVHHIPQQAPDSFLSLKGSPIVLEDQRLHASVLHMLTAHFKTAEVFRPMHMSPAAVAAERAMTDLSDMEAFEETASALATRLYSVSGHPGIPAGDLYIGLLSDVGYQNKSCTALAIIKGESHSTVISASESEVEAFDGLDISKPQKGGIFILTEEGVVAMVTDTGRRPDAAYWVQDFLGIEPVADEFQFTRNVMAMTRAFVEERMPEQFEVERPDQIDLLNRSMEYFKQNETYDDGHFATEVFRDPAVIGSFKDFRHEMTQSDDIPVTDRFAISQQAVKGQQKIFKSVLKLDKNFHIYIHGNRNLIESGFDDEKGMRFYKVFYKDEA